MNCVLTCDLKQHNNLYNNYTSAYFPIALITSFALAFMATLGIHTISMFITV